jgi:hypothetical protein
MSMLNQRLQVLIDEERMDRLELLARERGASVGHLVREAIDLAFPSVPAPRRSAADRLLDRPELNLSGDWDQLKPELLELDHE